MAGYKGYSMSNNAFIAYEEGEKPLSKWSKQIILEEINNEIGEEKGEILKKLSQKQLRDFCLEKTGWHHTSKYFNQTNFYSLNIEKIHELSLTELKEIVKNIIEIDKEEKAKKKIIKNANNYSFNEFFVPFELNAEIYPASKVDNFILIKYPKEIFAIKVDETSKACLCNSIEKAKKIVEDNNIKKIEISKKEKMESFFYCEMTMTKLAEEWARNEIFENSTYTIEKKGEYFQICGGIELSNSLHYYSQGRKPKQEDYEKGLENFFKLNEKRLAYNKKLSTFYLEKWNGNKFVNAEAKENSTSSNKEDENKKPIRRKNMQKLIVEGNLVKDIELQKIVAKDGKEYIKGNMTIAVNENGKEPVFLDFDIWSKQAENAGKFLQKGSKVFVEGTIQNNNYEKDGVKHYGYKFVAENINYLANTKNISNEMADIINNRPKKASTPKKQATNEAEL